MFYPYQHGAVTKGYRQFDSFGGLNDSGNSTFNISGTTSTSDVSTHLSDLNTFTVSLWYKFTGLHKGDATNAYPRALNVNYYTPYWNTGSGYTERTDIEIWHDDRIVFDVVQGSSTGQKTYYFEDHHRRALFSGWNHLVISSGHTTGEWLRFYFNGSETDWTGISYSPYGQIGNSLSTYQYGRRGTNFNINGYDTRLLSAVIVPGELRPYTDFAQFNSYGQLEYKPYSGPTSMYSHDITTKRFANDSNGNPTFEDRGKTHRLGSGFASSVNTTSDHPKTPTPKLSALNHQIGGYLIDEGGIAAPDMYSGTGVDDNSIFTYNFPFEQTTSSNAQKVYFEFEIPSYAWNSYSLPSGPGKLCICTDLTAIGDKAGVADFNDCLLVTEDGAGLSENFNNGVTTTFNSSPTQDWRPGQRYKVAIDFYEKKIWVGYCGTGGSPGYWSAQIGGSQPTTTDLTSVTESFSFGSVLNGTAFYVGTLADRRLITNHEGNNSQAMLAFYTQAGELQDQLPTGYKTLGQYVAPRPLNLERSYAAANPQEYVKALTYTGNGGTQTFDLGWQPDLVLFTNASGSSITKPTFFDSTNGASVALPVARENPITSRVDCQFTATGLQVSNNTTTPGSSGYQQSIFTNQLNSVYKAFCWKKSANAGFDVVSYVGNGGTQTISHNCGGPVHFMMIKCVDSTQTSGPENAWVTWHRGAATNTQMQEFWEFGAEGSVTVNANEPRFNNQIPTSSNFYVGNDNSVNQSGKNYIAYLWTSRPGFSAFGQGVTDAYGARAFCAFKPAIVILKNQYDDTPNIITQNTDLLFGYDATSTSSSKDYLVNSTTYENRFGVWANGDGGDLDPTNLSNVITYHPDGFEVFNHTWNLFGYQQNTNGSVTMDSRFVWAAFAQPITGVSR